jgi:hypothetical protein
MGCSGKLELETLGKLLLLSAFLVVVILIFVGVKDSIERNQGSFGDYVCFASNLLKHNVVDFFPSGCSEGRRGVVYVKGEDKVVAKEQVAELIDKCWWMYGSGEWDLGPNLGKDFTVKSVLGIVIPFDFIHLCYAFSLEKNMSVNELFGYMQRYNRDGKETSVADPETYWNYIQKNSIGEGIGVDRNLGGELKKNKVYYIIFLDERHLRSVQGSYTFKDKILISDNKNFKEFLSEIEKNKIRQNSKEFQKHIYKWFKIGE